MNFFSSIGDFIVNALNSLKDNTFLKDGLSIDETKVSAMIVVFLVAVTFALIMYGIHGDITINLLNLLSYLIFGITGVNVVDKIVSRINQPTPPPTQVQETIESITDGVEIPVVVKENYKKK